MKFPYLLETGGCLLVVIATGCSTAQSPKAERGPDGTIAYKVEVESSTPGARIEVNDDYVGKAPITITIYGDADGTFHNFGSKDFVVRALPSGTNQFPQTKLFRTGGWFSEEDRVPKKIYFDMEQGSGASNFTIDLKPRY
jgi:hypothetical protein